MVISVIAWIVVGLIAGFIASRIVSAHGEGLMLDLLLGMVGAMLGGWIFRGLGSVGVTGFNLWSLMVAVIGAVVLLVGWHAVRHTLSRA